MKWQHVCFSVNRETQVGQNSIGCINISPQKFTIFKLSVTLSPLPINYEL